jgi:hypothetical membrane protein
MLYSGSYSPLNNWLSDLGNSTFNPAGYFFFNIGCILTGLTMILAVLGLVKWKTSNHKQNKLILLSQYIGGLMAFALIMVGVFSENYGKIHYIWAAIFFISLFIFLIVINSALKNHANYIKWIWYYSIVSIVADFIFMFTMVIGLKITVLQWLAVFSGLIWIGLIGYNTLGLQKSTN